MQLVVSSSDWRPQHFCGCHGTWTDVGWCGEDHWALRLRWKCPQWHRSPSSCSGGEEAFARNFISLPLPPQQVDLSLFSPVCLPPVSVTSSEEFSGQNATAVGWGALQYQSKSIGPNIERDSVTIIPSLVSAGDYPETLQELQDLLPIVTKADCVDNQWELSPDKALLKFLQIHPQRRPSTGYVLCRRSRPRNWHLPGRLRGTSHSAGELSCCYYWNLSNLRFQNSHDLFTLSPTQLLIISMQIAYLLLTPTAILPFELKQQ